MKTIEVEEVSSQIIRLIAEVGKGEDFVIVQDNKPVAKLVPIEPQKKRPQFGSARGMFTLSPDFNDPLEDFEEYM